MPTDIPHPAPGTPHIKVPATAAPQEWHSASTSRPAESPSATLGHAMVRLRP